MIRVFYRLIFEKYSNIKFHENTFSGNLVVPCGRTDMTRLVVAFRNFTNASKNRLLLMRFLVFHVSFSTKMLEFKIVLFYEPFNAERLIKTSRSEPSKN
jgi:hypothetical protein